MNDKTPKKLINLLKALILPVAVYLIMVILSGRRFGTADTIVLLFRQSIPPILITYAIAFLLMMRMMDLSAGAVVYVSAMLGNQLAVQTGCGPYGLLLFCILITVAMNALTALLYRITKLPIMVLSVGIIMIYEGLPRALGVSNSKISLGDAIWNRSPWCFILLGIMTILFFVLYNLTPMGKNVRAISSDQKVARNSGVNVERTKLLSFIMGGVFLGVAAPIYMSSSIRLLAPASFQSVSLAFDAIMGIFLAFFLMRYCNYTLGIIIGCLTMQMLIFGLLSLGLSSTIKTAVQGLFLLLVLVFSSNQSRVEDYRRRKRLAKEVNQEYEEKKTAA